MPKKSYILALLGMALAVSIVGCVDTSVQPIPSTIDYRSHVKLVNFADGVSSADFTMENADGSTISFGAIAFGNEDAKSSSFNDIPAGSKTLLFGTESLKLTTDVDQQIRLFILGPAADRTYTKVTQRYIFQTQDDPSNSAMYRPDTAGISIFNGSIDAVIDEIHAVSTDAEGNIVVDTTFSDLGLELGAGTAYKYLKAGNYNISVLSGSDIISTIQVNTESKKRYTAAIYDVLASLKNKVFTDD